MCIQQDFFIFSSFQEWAYTMARRPSSVCLSVCKLLRKLLLLAGKWPDRHQTFTRWTSGQCASRVCSRSRSRSKVTWYGHFCAGMKIASSPRQMAGSRPNLHRMVTKWTCIQDVLKVKVKGHVIWALLCWHKNRFFSKANGRIATKLAHDGLRESLHPGCAQGQGQGQRSCDMRTFLDSWNELLHHWRSGFHVTSKKSYHKRHLHHAFTANFQIHPDQSVVPQKVSTEASQDCRNYIYAS